MWTQTNCPPTYWDKMFNQKSADIYKTDDDIFVVIFKDQNIQMVIHTSTDDIHNCDVFYPI